MITYKITEEEISEILSLIDKRKMLAVKRILVNLKKIKELEKNKNAKS